MRKTGMVLAVLWVLWFIVGCDGGAEPRIKVGVEAKNRVPVVVVNDANEKLPVEIDVIGGRAIPVEFRQRSGEAVPVKIETDKIAIGIAAAAGLSLVLTSIFAFMAARNSRTAAENIKGAAEEQGQRKS